MPISIRPLTPNIAGEVSGVDITKPLSKDEVAAIEAGMDKHAVLVFRDQDLTDEQQMAFTRNFGAIEDARGGNVTKPQDKRLATGMNDVSNLGKDGKPLARDSRQRLFNIGNMLWHQTARSGSRQYCSTRVNEGRQHRVADMRAAAALVARKRRSRTWV
jgi:alpha-ketoglutarate-dependent 2,4-dichlorophenoxyacetate dioxygenase